jgi:hypothetical protein
MKTLLFSIFIVGHSALADSLSQFVGPSVSAIQESFDLRWTLPLREDSKPANKENSEDNYHMSLGPAGLPCPKPAARVGEDCRDKKAVMEKLDTEKIIFQNPNGKLIEGSYGSAYGACGAHGGYLAHRMEQNGVITLKYYKDFTDKQAFGPREAVHQGDLNEMFNLSSRFNGDELAQVTGQVKIPAQAAQLISKRGVHFCVTKDTMKNLNAAHSNLKAQRILRGSFMDIEGFTVNEGQK